MFRSVGDIAEPERRHKKNIAATSAALHSFGALGCGLLLLLLFSAPGSAGDRATRSHEAREHCQYWESQVDPRSQQPVWEPNQPPDDTEVIEAIGCLLELRGRNHAARFWGGTHAGSSMISGPASVQVAALFYASYLFTGRWYHAQAVELTDARGKKLARRRVRAAYRAYENWFERIQRLGLSEARRKAIDPLDGTGMHWR